MPKIIWDNPVYENDRYVVVVGDFGGPVKFHGGEYNVGYNVVNKEYRVCEVSTPQLPDAIAAAEQLDIACEQETWKWVRINFESEMFGDSVAGPDEVH